MKGYFENPKANAESFDKDGWFMTGDIAYCDGASKLWYIVDRKKVREICDVFLDSRCLINCLGDDQSSRLPSSTTRA